MRLLDGNAGIGIVPVVQTIDLIRAVAQRCHTTDKWRIIAELTPHSQEQKTWISDWPARKRW